ncbi:ABC transporter substrate-binding protein [Salimicrobium halophilum]|uniref:Multiple sugar transport system substrate-binding protein n=1 Tax=Salimicrobium halophilum TaxID=86666 RepID=A0A1G8T8Q9_9BACI|nr:extracellular solute-binding protein [Salimicrobium halophilum]SDJ37355.1 multiple sugar transport system substrate-binding protein [Salimicrobium halophilum]
MNKKWLEVMVSTLILTSLMLAGCSNGENAEQSESESDEVTLKLFTWINEENGNWEETISTYEEENPGVNVEVNTLVENMSADDYLKQLDLLAASGDELDLIMFPSSEDLAKRISTGMVEPLNNYIDEEDITLDEVYNTGPAPATDDGEYYGIPSKYNTYLIMMNKNHLDEAGLEIPEEWTWDDYREYASTLTTDERYGSYLHTWSTIFDTLKMFGKGEENLLIKSDGSSNMDDPLVKESLQLRHNLEKVDESSVPYADIISQQLSYRQQFFSQSASMIPIPSYMVTEWGGYDPEFEIAWAPWPKNDSNDQKYRYASADILSMGESSENKDEAYKFMRWMTTEGMLVQGKSIPAWKQTDTEEVLNELANSTSNPEAVHVPSLLTAIETGEEAEQFLPAGYMTEVYSAYKTEVEKYLLEGQSLDITIENAKQSVQDIIDANK